MRYIHARYEGIQESMAPGLKSFALWTIFEELPGHPKYSTLSIHTLQELGLEPVETDQPEEVER